MATTTTVKEYTGDGSDLTWTYTFQSYQKEEIKVDITKSDSTWVNVTNFTIPDYTASGGTVTFNNTGVNTDVCESTGAPTSGRTIRIYRETDIITGSVGEYEPKTTYQVGSSIRAGDLNNNQKQALYAIYEVRDQEIHETKIRDGAVTSAKIADGTIANVDISATAEIEVSKLKDGTARQLLQTDSGGTGVEWTSNVDVPGTLDVTGAADFDSTVNVDGTATLATVDINGGAIDGTVIGAASAVAGSFTTVNASGTITGNVTGNLTGNVTGNVTGNLTGNADTATDLAAAAKITASEENGGITANDTTYFTTSASDARYYQIGTSDDIDSTETWNSSDVKVPTTKAVDARVITLVDEVGGFVPITDERDFPATNPDINSSGEGDSSKAVGTIVSIGPLTTSYTSSGSGVITIPASTLSNLSNDLTITGAANNTTYGPNFGMLVETKALNDTDYAANPSYTFHRLVPKASEVTTLAGKATEMGLLGTSDAISDMNTLGTADVVSDMNTLADIAADITTLAHIEDGTDATDAIQTVANNVTSLNNFEARYRVGSDTTDPTSSLDPGDLFFAYDSSTPTNSKLRVYNGSSWQDGVTATGNLIAKTGDTFTGDVKIDNGKEIRLIEPGGGANYTGFKAQAQSGDVTYSLPAAAAGTDKYLKTTSGDATVLEWGTVTSTPEGEAVKSTTNGNEAATKYLRADGSGGASWETVSTTDATKMPLAGGTFTGDVVFDNSTHDGFDITWDESDKALEFADDTKAVFGTDDGLTIVHDTTTDASNHRTYIENTRNDLVLKTSGTNGDDVGVEAKNDFWVKLKDGAENAIFCNADAEVSLYYNGNKKFDTTNTGIDVTGNIVVSGTVDGIDIATDVAANTAKVSNATHTGDVTGSTVLTIANDAVTGAKLNISLVEGDVIYASGTDTLARLAKGSAGEVLKMNSGETAPEWGTAGVTVANDANNRVVTGTGSGLNAEANLSFDGSTLAVTGNQTVSKQISAVGFEAPAEIAADWSIAAANNAMYPGPMTIASGVSVTVPASRTLTIV